jgi:hypothetical protein
VQAVVLPIVTAYALAIDIGMQPRSARLFALVSGLVFLWIFWQAGNSFPIVRGGAGAVLSLEGIIGRLGVIGVTTTAMLSGYGAVATPYNFMNLYVTRVKEAHVAKLQKRVETINFSLAKEYGTLNNILKTVSQ